MEDSLGSEVRLAGRVGRDLRQLRGERRGHDDKGELNFNDKGTQHPSPEKPLFELHGRERALNWQWGGEEEGR